METLWKNALDKGKEVSVKIKNNYLPNNTRPISFDVEYRIDGKYYDLNIINT